MDDIISVINLVTAVISLANTILLFKANHKK